LVGNLVLRGFIVGIVAGLLAFGWAKVFAEPAVGAAITFESAQDQAKVAAQVAAGQKPEPESPEIFSRTVQSGIGLLTGLVVVGAGIGCLFAVMFAFANGRIGDLGPGPTAALLAFFALMSVYVIPALKYPPNPPPVGEPETIKYRTGLYFLMMAISIASTMGAYLLRRRLVPRFGSWNGSLMAIGAYLLVIGFFFFLLPGINEVPAAFPAVTLWNFRLASLSIQIVLWGSVGILFGYAGAAALANKD
jgi:Probable cobalt transporter subunit (CbtA)